VFQSDGSIVAVNTITSASSTIAPAGTITDPDTTNCGITQWGQVYIIIVSLEPSGNGYFIWDGTTFYFPGDAVPGMTTVPTGITGSAATVYAGAVWVISNDLLQFSAPGSVTDFSTADGGGSATSVDSTLRVRYTQIVSSNGYLYLFGDSSISYIAGVQTSGSPPTTTYTQQNVDPEVGTPWPATVDVLGSNIVFANPWGAHVSFGGRAAKVSDMLDGIYNTSPTLLTVDPPPSAAKHIMFGKRVWVLLIPVVDSYTGDTVNKMFLWDTKKWYSTQQSIDIDYIQNQEINSVLTAYGTEGAAIYPLFAAPNTTFTKVVQSKLWATPEGIAFGHATNRFWAVFSYNSTEGLLINVSIDSEMGESAIYTIPLTPAGTADIIVVGPEAVGQQGVLTGLTIVTNAADLTLNAAAFMPVNVQYRG
jgi:hypothetical protein